LLSSLKAFPSLAAPPLEGLVGAAPAASAEGAGEANANTASSAEIHPSASRARGRENPACTIRRAYRWGLAGG
jgi:hypothetical protein